MATSGAAAGFGDAAVVLGEAAAVIRARLSSERELPVVRPDQSWQLEERFGECHNPAPSDIVLIAAEVGISEAQTVVRDEWKGGREGTGGVEGV